MIDDARILAHDENRLVLSVQAPEERPTPLYFVGVGVLLAIAVATCFAFLYPRMSIAAAMFLWLLLCVPAVSYVLNRTVLVVLRDEDEIFVERRNRWTGRRHRQSLGQLSSLQRYEVSGFIDTDTDMFPHSYYELRLVLSHEVAVWYTASRETAVAVGEELMRLSRTTRDLP